jgi:lipid-binding SYLF domain-containing protein
VKENRIMKARTYLALALGPAIIAGVALPGCSTAPPTQEAKQSLSQEAKSTMDQIYADDPGIKDFVDHAEAYVIFPSVGKGGVGVGAAYGRGEVYQHGQLIGYADLSQGSIGLQLGGQTFTELIVFETPDALEHFKDNKLSFAANASAVAIKTGVAATAKFEHGVAVFVRPQGGAMFEASVGGQQLTFQQANNGQPQ